MKDGKFLCFPPLYFSGETIMGESFLAGSEYVCVCARAPVRERKGEIMRSDVNRLSNDPLLRGDLSR